MNRNFQYLLIVLIDSPSLELFSPHNVPKYLISSVVPIQNTQWRKHTEKIGMIFFIQVPTFVSQVSKYRFRFYVLIYELGQQLGRSVPCNLQGSYMMSFKLIQIITSTVTVLQNKVRLSQANNIFCTYYLPCLLTHVAKKCTFFA